MVEDQPIHSTEITLMQSHIEPLLIRVDANKRLGTGHLMRCLALAQHWQENGGSVIFIIACENRALLRRLYDEDFHTITLSHTYPDPRSWQHTSQVLKEHSNSWVVLDGYHFDTHYQQLIKDSGNPLMVIDDAAHLNHYYADVVINQNVHAEGLEYICEPYTRLLLGSKYVLLRREFWPWCGHERNTPREARKVLVTLGGVDPGNQTFKVVQALQRITLEGLEVTVVVGATNTHYRELKDAVRDLGGVRVVQNATNMPELMAWADLAISSGGSTCWELAFMGLPAIVGQIAEVENLLAEGLRQIGLFLNTGWFVNASQSDISEHISFAINNRNWRERMSNLGQKTVDGKGGTRILKALI